MDFNVIDLSVANLAKREFRGLTNKREKLKTTGSNLWRYTENYHTDIKRIQSTH